ncbi:MAG: DUF2303 family protein [Pseudomonadota bacterium]
MAAIGTPDNTPRIVVEAYYKDERTGALYIHQDLVKTQDPWEEEKHISPMNCNERFGDVESFVDYVKRYGTQATLLTWNSQGLLAILDHAASDAEPGRRQWRATHPFVASSQWQAWMRLASGQAVNQKAAVEAIEDQAEDIVDPPSADLANLLRSLRMTINSKAEAELRPDGTSSVSFERATNVKATGGSVDLPASFTISIPVHKGHIDEQGRPVLYRLDVRLRTSTDSNERLALRLSIPTATRVIEAVYEDRVAAAAKLLGDDYKLLRAAD